MIEEVEVLLQHWGDQMRGRCQVGGMRCSLGAVIEWGGAPPRSGKSDGLVWTAMDHAAMEVDAVLSEMAREGARQDEPLEVAWKEAGHTSAPPFCHLTQLVKLARVRYLTDTMPTVEQQMRRVKIAGKRTYHDRVHRLHELVQAGLESRADARAIKRMKGQAA